MIKDPKDTNRIKLIKILEILRQDSDEENYLPTPELLRRLTEQGIKCDRRTLYSDIEMLNGFGYEVLAEKSPGKPNSYCIADRNFNVSELRILMDAVQASCFITPKKTAELIDKIADLGGTHRAELLKSNVVKFNTVKSSNENIFYAINEITQSIEQGKKVSFKYFDFDEKRNRIYRKGEKKYFVNPVATVFSDDNYYLICYYGKHSNLVHYRIDRMDMVELVPDQIIDQYPGEPFDLSQHKLQLFGMYQGNEQEVEFFADKSILDPIFDKFGESIELTTTEDDNVKFQAKVQISPVFFGWCCTLAGKLTITNPSAVVNDYKTYVQRIIETIN